MGEDDLTEYRVTAKELKVQPESMLLPNGRLVNLSESGLKRFIRGVKAPTEYVSTLEPGVRSPSPPAGETPSGTESRIPGPVLARIFFS